LIGLSGAEYEVKITNVSSSSSRYDVVTEFSEKGVRIIPIQKFPYVQSQPSSVHLAMAVDYRSGCWAISVDPIRPKGRYNSSTQTYNSLYS
jgi:hypothetical protein